MREPLSMPTREYSITILTMTVLVDFKKIIHKYTKSCSPMFNQLLLLFIKIAGFWDWLLTKSVHITIWVIVIQLLEVLIHLLTVNSMTALSLQDTMSSKLW